MVTYIVRTGTRWKRRAIVLFQRHHDGYKTLEIGEHPGRMVGSWYGGQGNNGSRGAIGDEFLERDDRIVIRYGDVRIAVIHVHPHGWLPICKAVDPECVGDVFIFWIAIDVGAQVGLDKG